MPINSDVIRYSLATRLSLFAGYYSSDEGFVKCSDLSHKIFALNKRIRLTSIRFRQS